MFRKYLPPQVPLKIIDNVTVEAEMKHMGLGQDFNSLLAILHQSRPQRSTPFTDEEYFDHQERVLDVVLKAKDVKAALKYFFIIEYPFEWKRKIFRELHEIPEFRSRFLNLFRSHRLYNVDELLDIVELEQADEYFDAAVSVLEEFGYDFSGWEDDVDEDEEDCEDANAEMDEKIDDLVFLEMILLSVKRVRAWVKSSLFK